VDEAGLLDGENEAVRPAGRPDPGSQPASTPPPPADGETATTPVSSDSPATKKPDASAGGGRKRPSATSKARRCGRRARATAARFHSVAIASTNPPRPSKAASGLSAVYPIRTSMMSHPAATATAVRTIDRDGSVSTPGFPSVMATDLAIPAAPPRSSWTH